MQHLLLRIEPRSAFATPLKGDTLFGQLCWAFRDRHGEDRLRELLQGYTEGRPFAIVSDAFPEHCWPRPSVPPALLGDIDPGQRKAAKRRVWLRRDDFDRPMGEWLRHMTGAPGNAGDGAHAGRAARTTPRPLVHPETRFRNSIDRRTGTTTSEGFAPYGVPQIRYREGARLDCHIVYDPERIDASALRQAMNDIGAFGFGRDATVGMGRFDVEELDRPTVLPLRQDGATSWLALAPVAPQGLPWNSERCWYRPFTRFGRHGNVAVHRGHPFKAPVLLADTGAVLTPRDPFEERLFVGQGLGGATQPLSRGIPETVHQGYAPVIGIRISDRATGGEAPG